MISSLFIFLIDMVILMIKRFIQCIKTNFSYMLYTIVNKGYSCHKKTENINCVVKMKKCSRQKPTVSQTVFSRHQHSQQSEIGQSGKMYHLNLVYLSEAAWGTTGYSTLIQKGLKSLDILCLLKKKSEMYF